MSTARRTTRSPGSIRVGADRVRHRPIVDLGSDQTVGVEVRTASADPQEVGRLLETVERELLAAGRPADGWWIVLRPMGLTAEVAVARASLTGVLAPALVRGSVGVPVVEVSEQALATIVRGAHGGALRWWEAERTRIGLSDLGVGVLHPDELRTLPLAHVRVAVDGLVLDEPADAAALAEVAGDARTLGVRVLADGIETDAQVALVAEAGIGHAMGYRWGSPGSLAKLVRTWARAS